MAILFLVLKIIGIVLLVIVIVLAAILFVPVCYRVEAESEKKRLCARIGWLFGLVSLRAVYEQDALDFGLYLFGIRLQKPAFWKRRRQRKQQREAKEDAQLFADTEDPSGTQEDGCVLRVEDKRAADRDSIKEQTRPAENADSRESMSAKGDGTFSQSGTSKRQKRGKHKGTRGLFAFKNRKSGRKAGGRRRPAGGDSLPGRILSYVKILVEYKQKELYGSVFRALKFFLFRARPRRLTGRAAFGFADPAVTGQVLGAAAVLPFLAGSGLAVEPDFETEETYLKADVDLRGRLHLVFAVVLAIRLFTNKDFRGFVHKLRHA